ncbi:MAG: hypothetical protein ABR591_12135 [Candidatus Velthaea sp.]
MSTNENFARWRGNARLTAAALRTFAACHCRDYARVDARVDAGGRVWMLEINSMASLGESGSFLTAARTAGYDFGTVVERMIELAARRAWSGVPQPC